MRYHPSHLKRFHDLPVHDYEPGQDGRRRPLPEPAAVAWRVRASWEQPFEPLWRCFLDDVRTEDVTALVVGAWWEEWDEHGIDPVLGLLLAEARRFPRLRALFLADVESEESEISWIRQGDLTGVLRAWPELTELGVRGGEGLRIEPLRHDRLRTLRVESGGLPAEPVRALASCSLPALNSLDLWLGTARYGGDCTAVDVKALLSALGRCAGLRHLGLKNSDFQDAVAAAVAEAPAVAGLTSLDLGMGTLGDEGGAALLSGQPLTHLRHLGLRHHFMGEEMAQRLRGSLEPHGVAVDLTPARVRPYRPESRYVAVGE
ncbi:STM4015 family protein [Streptomyces griseoviridis]